MEQYPHFWNKANPAHATNAIDPTQTPNTTSHQSEHKLDKVRKLAYNSSYEWEIFYSTQATATTRTFPSSDGFVHNEEMMMATCIRCGEFFPDERQEMGFYRCIPCNTQYAQARGEEIKKQSVPLNKSNYMYISNAEFVKQLNPKRTT